MRQTETYKFSLIEMTDPFSPDELNKNVKMVEKALTEIVPAGSIFWYAKETAPDGYLICDGSNISRTDYARLFDAIGTAFGEGDGETTFTLPDLRAKFVRGAGQSDIYSADFGETQSASSICLVGSQNTSDTSTRINITDCDAAKSSIIFYVSKFYASTSGNNSGGYTRPYNIALTPIIKY